MPNKTNKFAYFGSDSFSIIVLEELLKEGFRPAIIVTTPPAPRGRGLVISPSPVKEWAIANGVPCMEPEKFDDEVKDRLRAEKFDMFIVASYGKILPGSVLYIPTHETLNVHPSLLPKYRGPSPIQSQILADEKEPGVSIMLLDEQMDHGRIISSEKIEIKDWPVKSSVLKNELASRGGKLLAKIMMPWMNGNIVASPQDHEQATFTRKLSKDDGLVSLSDDGYKNYLKFCAYEDSIGVYFFAERGGKKIRVKILDVSYENGAFAPLNVVPEGGKQMNYQDFLRGSR